MSAIKRDVIGKGTYGCVHKPSLHCTIPPSKDFDYSKHISKIMGKEDAIKELNEFVLLAKVDPHNEFHLGKPYLCEPKNDAEAQKDVAKCYGMATHFSLYPDYYRLLLQEYGGYNLEQFCKDHLENYLKPAPIKNKDTFWLEVHRLLRGLQTFKQNDLVHLDLKPQNIVFHPQTGRLNFIDFGLATSKKKIIELGTDSKYNKHRMKEAHWSYPLDIIYINQSVYSSYKPNKKQTNVNSLLANKSTTLIPNPKSFHYFFSLISNDLNTATASEIKSYFQRLEQGMKDMKDKLSHDKALPILIDAIDVYGLGFTLQYVLSNFALYGHMPAKEAIPLEQLFKRMYDFNPYTRLTDIDQILLEYENILLQIGVLQRLGVQFNKHHEIVRAPASSHKTEKTISVNIYSRKNTEMANKDPLTTDLGSPSTYHYDGMTPQSGELSSYKSPSRRTPSDIIEPFSLKPLANKQTSPLPPQPISQSIPVSVDEYETFREKIEQQELELEVDEYEKYLGKELEQIQLLAETQTHTELDSGCIRNIANWSKVLPTHKLDRPNFDPIQLKGDIPKYSPKLHELLKNIARLDREDMLKHKRKFKHFIFSDIKTNQGAKIIAAALLAHGFQNAVRATPVLTKKNKTKKQSPKKGGASPSPSPSQINSISPSEISKHIPTPHTPTSANASASTRKNLEEREKTPEKEKDKTKYKLALLSDDELLQTKGDNFLLLSSASLFNQPLRVEMKKNMLKKFNQRPDNVYGELARIIVMDSGFKEGIDLFDIKYIHIYEPQTTMADQKQVIGRGTRTCGQKGLKFHPQQGWPLHVYKYDLEIPQKYRAEFLNSTTAFELYLKSKNIDIRINNLTEDMETAVIEGAVDYDLNRNVHEFTVANTENSHSKGGAKLVRAHDYMRKYVREHFSDYAWEKVKMENLCGYEGPQSKSKSKGGASNAIQFTPTQGFVSQYFTPQTPVKGMLLYHSVGTGKTCSAIATATTQFEPAGYTILWVTRTTLKNDIWKNMFDQVCHAQIRQRIANGETIPDVQAQRMRLLSKAWSIRPMSYKQFSNLVSKRNKLYQDLVKKNGAADPLRKTLLIIDEAHKLFGGNDLSSIERPDTKALHEAIMNSYIVSGTESVRLLLMTATPITQSPMELIQLMNLCFTPERQMPEELETFAMRYLTQEGRFTEEGRAMFLDHIAGHISYLNREGDARQFSRPILHNVMVPMLDGRTERLAEEYNKGYIQAHYGQQIKTLKQSIEELKPLIEKMKLLLKDLAFLKKKCEGLEGKMKTACNKIVGEHAKMIVEDNKELIAQEKENLEQKKQELKELTQQMREKKKAIAENWKKADDASLDEYKVSVFHRLKTECIDTRPDEKIQQAAIQTHPAIIRLKEMGEWVEGEEKKHTEQQQFMKKSLQTKIKTLNKTLKLTTVPPSEKTNIRQQITEARKEIRQGTQKLTKTITKLNKCRQTIRKQTKKATTTVRKSAKKYLAQKKKERKELEKELKKLHALEREADSARVMEHLREEVKQIVNDHIGMIDTDLKDLVKNAEQQEIQKQLEKEKEKERKQQEKEKEKAEKAAAKKKK